jgi:hypothetical protein
MPYGQRDPDEQREVIHEQLKSIERTLQEHNDKFQKLAMHLVGKPINGEPVDNEGGWCGRMTRRVDAAESNISTVEGNMQIFEQRTPTKKGLYTLLVVGTMILGLIQGICVAIVRTGAK